MTGDMTLGKGYTNNKKGRKPDQLIDLQAANIAKDFFEIQIIRFFEYPAPTQIYNINE